MFSNKNINDFLRKAFPKGKNKVMHSFLSATDNPNKKNLIIRISEEFSEEESSEIKSFFLKFPEIKEIIFKPFTPGVPISDPLVLRSIKIKQPASYHDIECELRKIDATFTEKELKKILDRLRKNSSIIRSASDKYCVSYNGLRKIPLQVTKNSSDIKRIFEIKTGLK